MLVGSFPLQGRKIEQGTCEMLSAFHFHFHSPNPCSLFVNCLPEARPSSSMASEAKYCRRGGVATWPARPSSSMADKAK